VKKKTAKDDRQAVDSAPDWSPSLSAFRPSSDGTTFAIKVVPRASRSQVEGWHGDALKVRLQAPPVEGKANSALVALLAEVLGIGKGQVEIISGETSRTKRVRVKGLSADQLTMRLGTGRDANSRR